MVDDKSLIIIIFIFAPVHFRRNKTKNVSNLILEKLSYFKTKKMDKLLFDSDH